MKEAEALIKKIKSAGLNTEAAQEQLDQAKILAYEANTALGKPECRQKFSWQKFAPAEPKSL